MQHPIVELAFWSPGDPAIAAVDDLIADPGAPLAKHGLAGIAETYAASTGAPLHHVHADWAAEMAIKSLGVDGALCEVVPTLRRAGIPFFVAKGPSIAYFDYPDPRMRPYTDLDVYVPEPLVTDARAALAALGYEKVPQVTGPLGGLGNELHGGMFGAVVEVHGHPIDNLHRKYLAPITSWLPHVVERSVCGVDVPVLGPAAHIALQAIHLGAGHRYQKLVLYRDIAMLLPSLDATVVDALGACTYLAVVLDLLRGFGRTTLDVPRHGVLHTRLVRALAASDPTTWDEYRFCKTTGLAVVNQPTLTRGAAFALSLVRPALAAGTHNRGERRVMARWANA